MTHKVLLDGLTKVTAYFKPNQVSGKGCRVGQGLALKSAAMVEETILLYHDFPVDLVQYPFNCSSPDSPC